MFFNYKTHNNFINKFIFNSYLLKELKALMRNKHLIILILYTPTIILHRFHKILLLHLKYLKH